MTNAADLSVYDLIRQSNILQHDSIETSYSQIFTPFDNVQNWKIRILLFFRFLLITFF